ncbi:MAG: YbfB/YjiJ family MFS transporter, partial [Gammaproteobacteria bacterium]|nr:YbfB/YjiJ family MFS transporter [Gammaproteobacteria bacterium]
VGRWGSQVGWIGCGVLALVLISTVWTLLGDQAAEQPATGTTPSLGAAHGPTRSDALWLVSLYGLAGFGYIITATFLPVIARQALPGSPWPDLFWPMFGLAIVPGALIGARAPIEWDNRLLLAAGYALQATGVILSVIWPTIVGFMLGSVLLGMPFTAITLFAVREARRLRGNASAGLIGYATASYGVGQIAGPLFAAPLAQRSGSFAVPLLAAGAVLGFGGLMFALVWWRARQARKASHV